MAKVSVQLSQTMATRAWHTLDKAARGLTTTAQREQLGPQKPQP